MPTINKKSTPIFRQDDRKQFRQRYYQMPQWRNLSKSYLLTHPLCEMCADTGLITPAKDIHHMFSPFDTGISENERINRLLDWDNLKALCRDCHNKIHGNIKKSSRKLVFFES